MIQNEVAECGLACLTMVANYHGHEIDLATLRSRFGAPLRGTSFAQLVECASHMNFFSRAVKLELSDIGQLYCPAILHWDLNHFVVLMGVRKGHAVICDPAKGKRTVNLQEMSESFTGVALELWPTAEFQVRDDSIRLSFRHLWSQAVGLRRSAFTVLGAAFLAQALILVLPLFLQLTLDRVVATGDLEFLPLLGLAFCGLTILKVSADAVRSLSLLYVNTSLNFQLGTNLLRHLLSLPLDFFSKRHIGDLQSRMGVLSQIRSTISNGLADGIIDGIAATSILVLLFHLSSTLALIAIVSASGYAVVKWALFSKASRATIDGVVRRALSDSQFLETLRAIQPIKIFQREAERLSVWMNLQASATNADWRYGKVQVLSQSCLSLFTGLEQVILLWLGAKFVVRQDLTLGMLVAFLSYRQMFSLRFQTLVDKATEYRALGVHLQRLIDIVTAAPEPHRQGSGIHRSQVLGRVEIRNIGFRYSEREPWLFRNLSFVIEPSQTVAVVGPTGQGKTTLLKIIMGLLSPQEGEVFLDGLDIRAIGLDAYRSIYAAVMQDDRLISGSLRDNISFSDPNVNIERVESSARLACIHDDIERMPMGYESLIGDMGVALSGGQSQRVLLARAMYREPKLLVLDESTSALDSAAERRVNVNIKSLGITRIIAAHRSDTIALADQQIDLSAFI